jgi:hypothetical protein
MNLERSGNASVWASSMSLLLVLLCQPVLAAEGSKNLYYQKALRLYSSLEYEAALLMLENAVRWSSGERAEQVSIDLLEGVLALEVQQSERGRNAFRKALALDSAAKLAFSVSPKITAVLEEVRAEVLASAVPAQPQESKLRDQSLTQADARQDTADDLVQVMASRTSGPSRLKLPVAIGGGAVAIGGVIAWGKARSLETRIASADPSIMTPQRLEDAVHQGRTFERVGWLLMGLGVATTAGSLLLLDRIVPSSQVSVIPEPGGASLSASWSLP